MRNRRSLLILLAVGLQSVPLALFAQAITRSRRIVWLSSSTSSSAKNLEEEIDNALRELGWAVGSDLVINRRYTDGDPSLIAPITTELLALKPDIFVASTDTYARAAAVANKSLPIVFVIGFDPVGIGLVKSLAAPGGNVTGFSVLNYELNPKRLSLLKQAIPQLEKVGVFYRDGDPKAQAALKLTERAAQDLHLTIVLAPFRRPEDIQPAFLRLAASGVKAVINVPDPMLINMRHQLADLAIAHRMAAAFGATDYAEAGMLMAYATDYTVIMRRASSLLDRLLKGAKPADTPVEQINIYDLVLNLQTARKLGIQFPPSLLLQATRVIE